MKRFAAALRRARREHRQPRQRSTRCKRYFAARRAARRRLGGVLPRRRQAAPGGAQRRAAAALACRRAGIADWLFDECYQAVGDFAETMAHVAAAAGETRATSAWPSGSSSGCCRCAAWRPRSRPTRVASLLGRARQRTSGFLLIKLIGGGFRVGVRKLLVQRALADGGGARRQARGAAHDGLHRRPRRAERRSATLQLIAPRARRRGPARPAASPIRSSSRIRSMCRSSEFDARLGAPERLDRRVEVRRHPRAAGQARRRRSGSGRAARNW